MKTVVYNIEANGLNPDKIWVVTCIDVDTGEEHEFRRPDTDPAFREYWKAVTTGVGHNSIEFDNPYLARLVGIEFDTVRVVDTLVISRLLDFARSDGHSLAAWGPVFGITKGPQPPWDAFSEELCTHSMVNCRITVALFKHFRKWLNSPRWRKPIELEHFMQTYCRQLHDNGFAFAIDKATELRYNINREVQDLDKEILSAFPPRVHLKREIVPRITKHGTLNRNDFRWAGTDLSSYNGGAFSLIEYVDFNPGSPSQIVERLNDAGWKPTERTKGHLQALRDGDTDKLERLSKTGWKVSEANLKTLPATAPAASHLLAKRITAASRVRTLTEWIDAYNPDTGRVHGSFNGIGAWTQRASHNRPNTANIPTPQPLNPSSSPTAIWANAVDASLRTFWCAGPDRYLVGVDAESIQLRILAHYINDERFTQSLLTGDKKLGTDPHSLNRLALGSVCHSRDEAKTFIYAWLLGAGVGKVAEILGCSLADAKAAVDNFIGFYPGLAYLKENVIPADAERGYFEGFDGRYVRIPGDDVGSRRHFTLAGYLQNGEKVIMATATRLWVPKLIKQGVPFLGVNWVHDEWQTEVPSIEVGEIVADAQADSIRQAGVDLNLRCPMAGAKLNSHGQLSIGRNWSETH